MAETLPAAAHGNGAPQNLTEVSERRNPEISIVVPVYNVGATLLTACIESALAQTFTDFELILVDDASTDDSAAVCERYLADPRVRLMRLPENRGPAAARNAGIDIARGSYMCFLDSDDRLQPITLQRLHDIASEYNADIVAASLQRINLESHIPSAIKKHKVQVLGPKEAIAEILYQHSLDNSPGGKLYRRKMCEGLPSPTSRYEDLRTFYHIFLRADKIAWTPEPLYLYTINPNSYMSTFTPERAVVLDVTDELVSYMEEHCPELVPAARDRALSAAFNILNLLTINRCNAPEIAARCRATIRRYRRQSLLNPRVRLKNKVGILLTYIGGFQLLRLAARIPQNA